MSVSVARMGFAKCRILIGDSIHRLTLESCSRMSAQEAHDRAIRLGRDFMEENRDIIAGYQSITRFEFITCHEIQRTLEYSAHHRAITDYFHHSPAFRESVECFGLRYHRNNWDMLSKGKREYRLNNSSSYFIEEFAIFACLVNRRFSLTLSERASLRNLQPVVLQHLAPPGGDLACRDLSRGPLRQQRE